MKKAYVLVIAVMVILTSLFSPATAAVTATIGVDWQLATDAAGYSSMDQYHSVLFNNRVWVLFPSYETTNQRNVWSSVDGITWTNATTDAGYTGYREVSFVQYNSRIYALGGSTAGYPSDYLADVWYTTNGADWTAATQNAAFGKRGSFGAVNFDGKMWVIAGKSKDTQGTPVYKTDVWSSTNGTAWTQETANSGMMFDGDMYATTFQSKIWVYGSAYNFADYTTSSEIWSSTNGVDWVCATKNAEFGPRYGTALIGYDSKLWIIAGHPAGSDFPAGDVWSSTDGVTWTQVAAATDFGPRRNHTSQVFNTALWVFGGFGNDGAVSDAWYTPAGPLPTPVPNTDKSNIRAQGGAKGYAEPDKDIPAGIFFTPSEAGTVKIKIFSSQGQCVWETEVAADVGIENSVNWNCKNKKGVTVSSGVYMVKIKGAGIDAKIRIAVVR